MNAGGQISVDGLNYYPFQFPGRDGGEPDIELDLDFTNASLPEYYDVNKPHKEMRSFPVPSGGLYFPNYFVDGTDAFLDESLNWWSATNQNGSSLPSEYCSFDSSGALHCVIAEGTTVSHLLSWDGGENWKNNTYDLSERSACNVPSQNKDDIR